MNHYISLAKLAVENYINENKIIEPPKDLPKEMLKEKAGTFVTIEKNGELRGCIGTYLPTKENIAREIIQNAVAAATEDYRFGQIKKEELSSLSYTVYLLDQPELVKDIKELNPKKYGIIIRTVGQLAKSALLLPDLEGVNTIEEQLGITCQKGDIDPAKEKLIIYRFTVKKYEER